FKLDGADVAIEPLAHIGKLLEFVSEILKLIQTIRDSVPKIGWYCDMSLSVMEGSVALEVGRAEVMVADAPSAPGEAEEPPWQTAMWAALKTKLTVVKAGIELGFGVKCAAGKIVVYFA